MGEMKQANAFEEDRQFKVRFASTLAESSPLVRRAGDDISRAPPRLPSVVADYFGPGADELGEDLAVGKGCELDSAPVQARLQHCDSSKISPEPGMRTIYVTRITFQNWKRMLVVLLASKRNLA